MLTFAYDQRFLRLAIVLVGDFFIQENLCKGYRILVFLFTGEPV